jgi:uracil-DNA glycosylase
MKKLYNSIKACKNCNLCKNQPPLLHHQNKADVFWVGLSAVKTDDFSEEPLSSRTNSGKLINNIVDSFIDTDSYKTNIVKCLPLKDKSIRYPSSKEMESCYMNLTKEIDYFNPKIIFLLGKQVASFVLKKYGINNVAFDDDFNFQPVEINDKVYIPIHHPSYVLVYKRKHLYSYISNIEQVIQSYSN